MPVYATFTHLVHGSYGKLCITLGCVILLMSYAWPTVTQAINQVLTFVYIYFGLITMVGVSLEVSPR